MLRKLLLTGIFLSSVPAIAAERIVALTPDMAELVCALGRCQELVGRDRNALKPVAVRKVPVIGFSRALTVEPIIKLKPTLVLGSDLAQPPAIWQQLRDVGVNAHLLGSKPDGSDFPALIRQTGQLLGRNEAAEQLAQRWQKAMTPLQAKGRRFLISYDGSMIAGRDTAADLLIRAAGGVNVAAEWRGMTRLNREVLQALQPDVVIVARHNRPVYGSLEALAARPELAASPAVKQHKLFEMDVLDVFTVGLDSPAVVRRLQAL